MKRWHEEYPRTYREWKKHYLSHVESNIEFVRVPGRDPYLIDCDCDQQKGRFRKRRALGCGRARCQLCHSYKYPKRETTRNERRSQLKFKEDIGELMVPASYRAMAHQARAGYKRRDLVSVFAG